MNDDESLQYRADMARMEHDADEREERHQARVAQLESELRQAQGQAVANGRKHAQVRGALLRVMGLQDGVMIDAQLREMRNVLNSLAGAPDNDAKRVSLYAIAVLLGEVEL